MTKPNTTRSRIHPGQFNGFPRFTAFSCALLLAIFCLGTLSAQAAGGGGEKGRVFKGPMAKMSTVRITVLTSGKSTDTVTDAEGQYEILAQVDNEIVQVRARGKFFDEKTGKITKTPVTLTAIAHHRAGDAAPDVNIISHLVAIRANALAGFGARGPFVTIVMPMVFPDAEDHVADALDVALSRIPKGKVTGVNLSDEGSLGQARVIHVSLVVSQAANKRARSAGIGPGKAAQLLLNDMSRDIAGYGRFSPAIISELRAAEKTMDGAAMLRNLVDAYGIGEDLLDDYLP